MRKELRLMLVIMGVICGFMIMQTSIVFAQAEKAGAADTLTGEKILDKYIEATGGKAAYAKLNNRYTHGSIEIMANLKADIISYNSRPNKLRSIVSADQMGTFERGFDGKVFWDKNTMQGARILEGAELADGIREEATFDKFTDWRSFYSKVEFIGNDSVNGSPCYKVLVYPKEGASQTWYFDQQNGLIVKITMTVQSQQGEIPSDVKLSDYRKIDGILTPFKMVSSAAGMTQTIVFDSIAHNIMIPDSIYALPAEIQEIVKNKAQTPDTTKGQEKK